MRNSIEDWIKNGAKVGGGTAITFFLLVAAKEMKKSPQLAIALPIGVIGWGIGGLLVGAVGGGLAWGGKEVGKKIYSLFPSAQTVQNLLNLNQGQNQNKQMIAVQPSFNG